MMDLLDTTSLSYFRITNFTCGAIILNSQQPIGGGKNVGASFINKGTRGWVDVVDLSNGCIV